VRIRFLKYPPVKSSYYWVLAYLYPLYLSLYFIIIYFLYFCKTNIKKWHFRTTFPSIIFI
jgi:hypothetical protein